MVPAIQESDDAATGRPIRSSRHAIVGTGGIAGVHAEHVQRFGGSMELVAALDVDEARLRAFCQQRQVPGEYTSLDRMLTAEDIDVVHLCTPPGTHVDQAVAVLEHDVSVLCEKPPALSLAGFDQIQRAEARSSGDFGTVFQHRFGSGAQRAFRLVGDARVGRPLTAVCHTLWYRQDPYFDPPWRGRWELEGGGPTMGHGIHQMDLLVAILGPWREVIAVSARQERTTNTEDLAHAIVTFDNGTIATIVNSFLSPREVSSVRVDFEYASLEVDHLYGYRDTDWRITAAPGHEEEVSEAWREGPVGTPSGHAAQFQAMLRAAGTGERMPVASTSARLTLELVAAIYASSFTRSPVMRGEIGPSSPFYTAMDGSGAPWPDVKEQH